MIESVGALIEKEHGREFYEGWCDSHGDFMVLMPPKKYRDFIPLCPFCYREHYNANGLKFNNNGEQTHDQYGKSLVCDENTHSCAVKLVRSPALLSLQRKRQEEIRKQKKQMWKESVKCEA